MIRTPQSLGQDVFKGAWRGGDSLICVHRGKKKKREERGEETVCVCCTVMVGPCRAEGNLIHGWHGAAVHKPAERAGDICDTKQPQRPLVLLSALSHTLNCCLLSVFVNCYIYIYSKYHAVWQRNIVWLYGGNTRSTNNSDTSEHLMYCTITCY